MNLKSVLKTINDCLDLANFKKKDESIRILPKQNDLPPTPSPISIPSVEHYYQNVIDNKDDAKLRVIALNKNVESFFNKNKDSYANEFIGDPIVSKDFKHSINYNHLDRLAILHNDYEPTIGDRIYADDFTDANQKISMIAIKSNKIIGCNKELYKNGVLATITSVNPLTNDQIREEAYYVWLETNEDSSACWEKAKQRLVEVK